MSEVPRPSPTPRPRPTPHRRPVRPSRRAFLIGGGVAVVAGAGAGVAAGIVRDVPGPAAPPPPDPALLAAVRTAVSAEMARAAAARSVRPQTDALRRVAANHATHEKVLRALVRDDLLTDLPAPSAAPRTLAQVRSGESTGATSAAAAAATLTGRAAVLLASISACEAAHAELLS